MDADIEILIIGNESGISENQRKIVLDALNKETEIKTVIQVKKFDSIL